MASQLKIARDPELERAWVEQTAQRSEKYIVTNIPVEGKQEDLEYWAAFVKHISTIGARFSVKDKDLVVYEQTKNGRRTQMAVFCAKPM